MAAKDKHAQMVVSLKPFGCMPSTMSDGVQSKVVADYKAAIFIPIETSGDAEVNVRSRVQMKLYEARIKARPEMDELLEEKGLTMEQVAGVRRQAAQALQLHAKDRGPPRHQHRRQLHRRDSRQRQITRPVVSRTRKEPWPLRPRFFSFGWFARPLSSTPGARQTGRSETHTGEL